MKKKLTAALALALTVSMALSGCTITHPLSEEFDEAVVTDAAQAILVKIVDGDYQAVVDAFRDDVVDAYSVNAQTIEDIITDAQKGAGDYVSIEETLVLGGKSKDFDEPFADVSIYCEYEKEDIIFEMSLDTNLELIGLSANQK